MAEPTRTNISGESARKLRGSYDSNPLAKRFLDWISSGGASFGKEGDSGKLSSSCDEAQKFLNPDIPGCRPALIAFMKSLGKEMGLGKFTPGRRKSGSSRFVWDVDPMVVAEVAQGNGEVVKATSATLQEFSSVKKIPYPFTIRPDFHIVFELPADLTREEAERLATFIKSCLITR